MGQGLSERAEVRRLVEWFDGKFCKEVSDKLLFEKFFKRLFRLGSPDTQAMRLGRQQASYHLDYISYLIEHHPWLAGDSMTLADLTAGAHLSTLDYMGDIQWQDYPRVKEWYAILKSRPSFRVILSERVLGTMPPPHYENPDF